MTKIQKLPTPGGMLPPRETELFHKINEIIDYVNSQEKEECKHEWVKSRLAGTSLCKKCYKGSFLEEEAKEKEEPKSAISIDTIRKAAEESNRMQREYAGLEPKSTLREATSDIIFGAHKYPELVDFTNDLTKFQTNLYADKIISLFKDTLLEKARYKIRTVRINGEKEAVVTFEDVEQIIQNL